MSAGEGEKGLSRIYRTSNRGDHWDLVFQDTTSGLFLNAMAFWDANHGIVLGDPLDGQFVLLTTQDGGSTWNRLIPNNFPRAQMGEGAFAASNSCLVVQGTSHVWFGTGGGATARVFHSADRGLNWSVVDTPMHSDSNSGIFSLAFRNTQDGIAVGGNHASPANFPSPTVIVTSDGGRTWRPQSDNRSSGYLSSAIWISSTEAWVIDGSQKNLNTLVCSEDCVWSVGRTGTCCYYRR
jgi:photosystem II stability/assembly factor-like uncharacterized protein